MAGHTPGAFFLGTLSSPERKFIKKLLENAHKSGYTRFYEPCCGAFAMSHLAVQVGFNPKNIGTSDVSMFSSIMGYAITGQDLAELEIQANNGPVITDPAVALYEWQFYRLVRDAGKTYFHNQLCDLKSRKEVYIEKIREQLDRAKTVLGGMKYQSCDIFDHVREFADDPNGVAILNPPTYTAGFEKWYDTAGRMTWTPPKYNMFGPEHCKALMEEFANKGCLLVLYEETTPGTAAGEPIFATAGLRGANINSYLSSNRLEEATKYAEGKCVVWPNESKMEPLKCSIMPVDHVITENSRVEFQRIKPENALYYRRIWTHNFEGSSGGVSLGMFIDGYLAGVFGYDKGNLTIGSYGGNPNPYIFLMYGMSVPTKAYRLGRLLMMLSLNRNVIYSICNAIEQAAVKGVKTVQVTKYPESKEMRSIAQLTNKVPVRGRGFRLTYIADMEDRSEKQTLIEWLGKEEQWKRSRERAKQST